MESRRTHRAHITVKASVGKRDCFHVCFSEGEQHLPAELHRSAGAKASFASREEPEGRLRAGIC